MRQGETARAARRAPADILRAQLSGNLPADLEQRSSEIIAALLAGETVDDVPPALAALYRPSVQPYLISWFKHDPAAELATVDEPALVVQGTTDLQISLADAERLAAAREGVELYVIEGMNHVLKDAPADRAANIAVYGDPTAPLSAGLADRIAEFIRTESK